MLCLLASAYSVDIVAPVAQPAEVHAEEVEEHEDPRPDWLGTRILPLGPAARDVGEANSSTG